MIQSVSKTTLDNYYEPTIKSNETQFTEDLPNTNKEKDTLELSKPEQDALPCENYTQIKNHPKMSNSTIQYECVTQISLYAREIMQQYKKGVINQEMLNNSFQRCCKLYLDTLEQTGISSNTDERKTKSVMHVYSAFQYANCTSATLECNAKGKQIAMTYGYSEKENKDYLYYDADIYYKSEQTKQTLTQIVQDSFDTYGIKQNAEKKIKETEKTTNIVGGLTFNSQWSYQSRYGANICTLSNIDQAPPEGFQFFYKERQNASIIDATGNITLDSQKGILIVGNKQNPKKIDIPFNNSTGLGKLAGIFNAAELYQGETGLQVDIFQFLKNFSIYTRTYSFINFGI